MKFEVDADYYLTPEIDLFNEEDILAVMRVTGKMHLPVVTKRRQSWRDATCNGYRKKMPRTKHALDDQV